MDHERVYFLAMSAPESHGPGQRTGTATHEAEPTVTRRPDGAQQPLILVGIDESEASRAAMRWAIREARLTHARIQAVAVWHLPQHFNDVPVPSCTALQDDANTWLKRAIPPNSGVRVDTLIVRGDPTAVLLQHAQRAQLIVLGNHGHGPIHTALLGSVAHRCANRAPCPVVLVPGP
jgi:nucleotide-binding universal stress UspA family protein